MMFRYALVRNFARAGNSWFINSLFEDKFCDKNQVRCWTVYIFMPSNGINLFRLTFPS